MEEERKGGQKPVHEDKSSGRERDRGREKERDWRGQGPPFKKKIANVHRMCS